MSKLHSLKPSSQLEISTAFLYSKVYSILTDLYPLKVNCQKNPDVIGSKICFKKRTINLGIFFESKAISDEKIMKFVSSVSGKHSREGDSKIDWFDFTRFSM